MRRTTLALALGILPFGAWAQPVAGSGGLVAPPGASSCSGCHSVRPGPAAAVPPIFGRPAAEIAGAMAAYRTGERPATIMTRIAKGFSPEESRAIAEWLEGRRP